MAIRSVWAVVVATASIYHSYLFVWGRVVSMCSAIVQWAIKFVARHNVSAQ